MLLMNYRTIVHHLLVACTNFVKFARWKFYRYIINLEEAFALQDCVVKMYTRIQCELYFKRVDKTNKKYYY